MSDELKPCPFCGSAPEAVNVSDVCCPNPRCWLFGMHVNRVEWNRRAPVPVPASTRERYAEYRRVQADKTRSLGYREHCELMANEIERTLADLGVKL